MITREDIQARPCAGEADVRRMIDLVAARPDVALHLADLPWRLCSPSARTPGRTRLWEDADGRLLAWAVLQFPWHCLDFAVSPDGERQGLGASVLDWAVERLEAEAVQRGEALPFYVSARADDEARIQLVGGRGFGRDTWRYAHLARNVRQPIPLPRLPPGFSIRPLVGEAEVDAYVTLHRAAFGSTNMTTDWRAATLRDRQYRPALDLVAVAPDGELVGFCVGWLTPLPALNGYRVAQIEPMGVLPTYQRRGLARALLLTCMQQARALGADQIEVDAEFDNAPALRTYEDVGFRPAYEALFFRRRFEPIEPSLERADPRDWSHIQPHYVALQNEALRPERVPDWLRHWSDTRKVVWEGWSGVKAAQEHDLTDETAQTALQRFIDEVLTPSEIADAALAAKLLAVEGWEVGPEHGQVLRRLRSTATVINAATVGLEAEVGSVARRYEAIGPTLTFAIDGVGVDKPEIDRRVRASDRSGREVAWRAQAAAWLSRRDEIDAIFLEVLDGRRRLAQAAGLPDYRAFRWLQIWRLDFTPADCRAFHEAVVAEVVPAAARRWEVRRHALGVATLRPWDLTADPAARAQAPVLAGNAFAAGVAPVLAAVDPELGELFGRMRAAGCLDIGWAPGKRGGGVERPYPRSGVPFVRVGVDGTESGVGTLLHEMGHAWHDHLTMTHQDLAWSLEHLDEFSEVAAFALYLLAAPILGQAGVGPWPAATAEHALAALLEEVLIDWLPTFALTDAFQHWVYAEAPAGVSVNEINATWAALTARFTPWVDWSGLEAERDAGWQRAWSPFLQPFYDLTYALAMVGALGIWRAARGDWDVAWQRYRTALTLGATRPLPDLFAAAGAAWPFDRAAVGRVVVLLEAVLAS